MDKDIIICGDALDVLAGLPEGSVHCVVTSPPYWGLRDYGTATWEGGDAGCGHIQQTPIGQDLTSTLGFPSGGGPRRIADKNSTVVGKKVYKATCGKCGAHRIDNQLGLEKTPEEYVAKMVEVFQQVRRVLRDDGTLWLNLGSSYAGSWGDSGNRPERTGKPGQQRTKITEYWTRAGHPQVDKPVTVSPPGFKPKDLVPIPWMVAMALQADGWYLRSDIIWAKPNPMPESVTDRPTKAHEYLFLLTKSANYFYDQEAIRESSQDFTNKREVNPDGSEQIRKAWVDHKDRDSKRDLASWGSKYGSLVPSGGRNRRSVWTIPTQPYPEAHFATFPAKLVEPCIKAGTSERGCCPECGKPWERLVEKSRTFQSGSGRAGNMPVGKYGPDLQGGGETLDVRRGPCVEAHTIGWQPGCECRLVSETAIPGGIVYPYAPIPCTVLDPFAGSGTVGMVAAQLGRSYICIELSEEYCAMARDRIGGAMKPETYTKADTPEDTPLFAGKDSKP